MDESRLKLIQKYQKKTAALIEDIRLLKEALLYHAQNTGEDVGVCTQLDKVEKSLRRAYYDLVTAAVSAEENEITDQMQTSFDTLATLAAN